MKRIIFISLIAILCTGQILGQDNSSTSENPTETTEISQTKQGDTVVISEWEDSQESQAAETSKKELIHNGTLHWNTAEAFGFQNGSNNWQAVAFLSVLLTLGFPIFITAIVFYFRYKNKKAKYALIEKALESGQSIPESFLEETRKENDQTRRSGINNIFIGIGLFIMLWALTGSFSVGCIGLFIMCIGFGKVVIYYTQSGTKCSDKKSDSGE